VNQEKSQAVVGKALQIARLMDEICALAAGDDDILELVTAGYPFTASLEDVSSTVVDWRDAMVKAIEKSRPL